eukprot:TRINITY_DN5063_c0_g1_i1.p1 TRINITY_DN5063_c0_g1~~TRINITY_DN5063_c0_g1_i1.p1  ORF type:complete len:244 (+),score=52.22 TRINITY_DN5063_c0_g1_i1:79-732(+)
MARWALVMGVALLGSCRATELTKETWDDAVSGKTVFVKFFSPWCGHCKKMKPDWDKLMGSFKDHASTLIADVDCTTGGKALCSEMGVQGYPTIKFGDPSDLQDYKGGRDYASLSKFASELGPQCSPANIDLCDDEKKTQITEFLALGADKRKDMIKEKEDELAKIEADFKAFVEGLQKQYSDASEKKEKDAEAVKTSGLGLLKSVQGYVQKTGKAEL